MIDAGLLQVGEELACEPPKRIGGIRKAYLQADGFIKEDNGDMKSLAQWSNAVKDRSSNAWITVTARGKTLDYFRKQFENGIEPPQNSRPPIVEIESGEPQSDTHSDVKTLRSEVDGLKSWMESQESEIARIHKNIDGLPIALPEDDTEEDIIRNLRERVLKLEPGEFEKLVGEYLKSKGFMNVVVNGRSGDGGIDGECDIPFINVKVAFQAKRYTTANNIGIDPVQRLQGSMTGKFDRGIFITTSNYTPAARGWVEEAQAQITLINGDELMKEMIDLGLGVKAVTVVKHEVDEDFFADL